MPAVRVKENEPFEVALRRFKRTTPRSCLVRRPAGRASTRGRRALIAPTLREVTSGREPLVSF